MKKIILLFVIFFAVTALGQNAEPVSILGEWACCGEINLKDSKEITFTKTTLELIHASCTTSPCNSSSIIFETEVNINMFSIKNKGGCKGELSGYSSKQADWKWLISNDNKKLILRDARNKQTRYIIVTLTATQLTLKKI